MNSEHEIKFVKKKNYFFKHIYCTLFVLFAFIVRSLFMHSMYVYQCIPVLLRLADERTIIKQ